ncbi:uncharacterized protein LOC105174110 [Sesamum indicum]|uniref:Uncharacterized protein LOC105174110 n=1 Tax=Sesamum indicum TaxID=4182 RepID=A0A6I9UJB4_SESIN|nr:uncharacterized protein LOC105174110 [Sesamum indicum]
MMAHKQFLHELLKEDQEPFHLKSYIADRQSQLKNPSCATTLQLRKRRPLVPETSAKRSNLCKHACFFSFQNSPDVRKSPFLEFPSPAKSPCKSPNRAVFLHIPSRTAALLLEAAMRIQKQQQAKPKSQSKNVGFGLFGSFLKRLKDRSKNKRRAIGDNDLKVSEGNATAVEEKVEETIRISCSCSNRRLSSADWTENNEDKSLDFEASTSSCGSECSEEINPDFGFSEPRFCSSPFRFALRRSPSSSGRRTPEFCSPAASPRRHVKKEKENYESRSLENLRGGEEEEEKEQCSPVSVLDPPFEDDDGHESRDAEEDDYDIECSYANVQRAKQQLLYRLRRFEKLAELDPMELERKLLEGSDEDDLGGEMGRESEDDDPLSLYRQQDTIDSIVAEVLNQSSLECHTMSMSSDMKKLVTDLIIEEKSKTNCSGNNDVVMRRICCRLDAWKQVQFDTIDMMIGLDFRREYDDWKKFPEQVEETAAEIELAIYGLLLEELLSDEELFHMNTQHQELDLVCAH